MSACTFFGHRDAYEEIEQELRDIIVNLIENKNVRKFYVGNQGKFDYMVRKILTKISEKYKIKYFVVLAYVPKVADFLIEQIDNTISPDEIEKVPKRFAIDWRNRWMLKNSDYVVTYVRHSIGGAAKFKQIAERQNKIVINLAEVKNNTL